MQNTIQILFEHPQWQLPLFETLKRRNIPFYATDLKTGVLDPGDFPLPRLVLNQASPSAYLRGNTSAVPFALAWMQSLEARGVRVLNGSAAFLLELSKSYQLTLLQGLGLAYPRSLLFHDVEAALANWNIWPALLKPQQGGSGARMFKVHNADEVRRIFSGDPSLWQPDYLYLLQELMDYDPDFGIIRMEFVGGRILYAMRVVSHGAFNLCPSVVCHPDEGGTSVCEIPAGPAVEFYAYKDIDPRFVAMGQKIAKAGKLDICGIEFILDRSGRAVFYDINANSNLRPPVAREFGIEPFEAVADYLKAELAARPLTFAFLVSFA